MAKANDEFDYKEAFKALVKQNEAMAKQNEQTMRMFQELLQNHPSVGVSNTSKLMHEIGQRVPMFQFDDNVEDCFSTWYERHQNVFVNDAKDLEEKDRVRLLLERLDSDSFAKYKNLVRPNDVFESKYDDTIKILKQLFDKSASLFTQRYQLLRHDKTVSQDFLLYVGEINELCEKTKLGDLKIDDWKCLMYVFGLKNSSYSELRKRLIIFLDNKHRNKEKCSLTELYDETDRFLGTLNDAKIVGSECVPHRSQINAVNKDLLCRNCGDPQAFCHNVRSGNHADAREQSKWTCWNCGQVHGRDRCPKPKVRCHRCDGKGHLEKYCERASKWSGNDESPKRSRMTRKVYAVEVEQKVVSPDRVTAKQLQRKMKINGMQVHMQVDTAAHVTLLSEAMWRKLGNPRLKKPLVKLQGPSGEELDIRGVLDCTFTVDGIHAAGEAHVNPYKNLLGLDVINKVPHLRHHAEMLVSSRPKKEDVVVTPDKVAQKSGNRTNKKKVARYVNAIFACSKQNQSIAAKQNEVVSVDCGALHAVIENNDSFESADKDNCAETCKGNVLQPALMEDLSGSWPKKAVNGDSLVFGWNDSKVLTSDCTTRKGVLLCPNVFSCVKEASSAHWFEPCTCLFEQCDKFFEKGGEDAEKSMNPTESLTSCTLEKGMEFLQSELPLRKDELNTEVNVTFENEVSEVHKPMNQSKPRSHAHGLGNNDTLKTNTRVFQPLRPVPAVSPSTPPSVQVQPPSSRRGTRSRLRRQVQRQATADPAHL